MVAFDLLDQDLAMFRRFAGLFFGHDELLILLDDVRVEQGGGARAEALLLARWKSAAASCAPEVGGLRSPASAIPALGELPEVGEATGSLRDQCQHRRRHDGHHGDLQVFFY